MLLNVDTGWIEGIKRVESPNFNARPEGGVSLLVIHGISLPPGEYGGSAIEELFSNQLDCDAHPYFDQNLRDLKVSSHFLIRRDGEIIQFVSTNDRAWHAGRSEFEGRAECNDFSIGIELEGVDDQAYEPLQYSALIALTALLQNAYPLIADDRITGHEHIAPGRKTDPGEAFDWGFYLGETGGNKFK